MTVLKWRLSEKTGSFVPRTEKKTPVDFIGMDYSNPPTVDLLQCHPQIQTNWFDNIVVVHSIFH